MGARLPGRRGAPARRHDPDRGLGADLGQLVHAGRRRPDLLLRPRPVARAASSTTSTATCPASTAPCRPRSAAPTSPGRFHLGPAGELRVLAPGEPSTDPYKATPDELYARGKAHFDAGRLAEAAAPLEELFAGYTLRDDVAKDAARMLLPDPHQASTSRARSSSTSRSSRRRPPSWSSPSTSCWSIGRAYRDINEYERAYLVWRGLIEASYLEDARVGEVLRQRGKTLEAIAYLIDLWRAYPEHGLDRERLLRPLAGPGPARRRRRSPTPRCAASWPTAGVTRSELLLQAIRLIQVFLSQSPSEPAGRRGEPGPGRRVPRAGGLRGGRQAARRGSPSSIPRARSSTASSTARPWPSSTSASTTGPSRSPRRSPGRPTRTPTASTSRARTSGRRSTSWARSTTPAASPAKALDVLRQVADRFTDAAGADRSR